MKILYHHRTRNEDAQGIHIAEIVSAFRRLGHEVEVVSPSSDGGGSGLLARLSAKVPRRQTWTYEVLELAYNAVGLWVLTKAIRRFQPDFVYERYALYMCCGLLVARLFRVPFILEVNAPLSLERAPLRFWRLASFLERWVCSRATKTIVVSDQLAALLRHHGVPDSRLVVMRNGVDSELFGQNVSGQAVRQRYGIDDRVVIGFVGWMRAWHNLAFALEAFADSKLAEKGGHLLLVGDGPAIDDLKAVVARRGLESDVTFSGPVPRADVAAYVAALDVAIQPGATPYASPIKLFEYMAMGRAIVAVAQPNIQEVLRDEQNALLFPSCDQRAFAQALERLVTDPRLRARLGAAARATIERQDLRWDRNARAVTNLVNVEAGSWDKVAARV
jgi:glycosyltransferase involved in cell wall biosynthesis